MGLLQKQISPIVNLLARMSKSGIFCLETLSTYTIIRSIICQPDGDKFLRDWVEAIMFRFRMNVIEPRLNPEHIEITRQKFQLLAFEDTYGIVAAAIDCCRNKITQNIDCNERYQVYFLPTNYVKYFRQINDDPPPVRKMRNSNPEIHTIRQSIYPLMIKIFRDPDFRVENAVELLELWFETVGRYQGETVELLLEDIGEDWLSSGGLKDEFATRRKSLLEAYYHSQAP